MVRVTGLLPGRKQETSRRDALARSGPGRGAPTRIGELGGGKCLARTGVFC